MKFALLCNALMSVLQKTQDTFYSMKNSGFNFCKLPVMSVTTFSEMFWIRSQLSRRVKFSETY